MRGVWWGMMAMLVASGAPAQEMRFRTPKEALGPPEVHLAGEEIGRKALLRVERQLIQEGYHAPEQDSRGGSQSGVDVLSDTQGVDFNPYLREMLRTIYTKWVLLMPAEARPPQMVAGKALIRFKVDPTGNVVAMSLDGSSHNDALNRAAWGAITETGHFRWLPAEFTGPYLELRIHFLVNKGPVGGAAKQAAPP